jgi:hypothetical protein
MQSDLKINELDFFDFRYYFSLIKVEEKHDTNTFINVVCSSSNSYNYNILSDR